jgi:Rrf2 family protein
MKVITKHTDYAVRALISLSLDKDTYLSSREMAETEGIPYQFLRRILQQLTKSGLVESKEGTGGGMKLAIDPSEIRIIDIIKIFQGEIELSECMFRKMICANRATCALRREIKRIENLVKTEFEQLTIGTLMEKYKNERR